MDVISGGQPAPAEEDLLTALTDAYVDAMDSFSTVAVTPEAGTALGITLSRTGGTVYFDFSAYSTVNIASGLGFTQQGNTKVYALSGTTSAIEIESEQSGSDWNLTISNSEEE